MQQHKIFLSTECPFLLCILINRIHYKKQFTICNVIWFTTNTINIFFFLQQLIQLYSIEETNNFVDEIHLAFWRFL